MRFSLLILIILQLLVSNKLYSNPYKDSSLRIEINAPSMEGDLVYLAYYWHGQTYISDSTFISKEGKALFQSQGPLASGQYLLFIKPDIRIELLIDEEQQSNIQISLDKDDINKSNITGSNDTKLFWSYINSLNKLQEQILATENKIRDTDPDNPDFTEFIEAYKASVNRSNEFTDAYIKETEGTWFSSFIKANKQVERPHIFSISNDEVIENNNYVRIHFFENIDFTDERLWRTSFFVPQINQYLTEWISQHPDSIAQQSSWLVSKTTDNPYCFEQMLSMLTNQATTSHVMGMENVWAKLAEDYIFDKNISWIDSIQYSNLKLEYSLIEHNRLGMTAPNLTLIDINSNIINTNEIEAEYLLLYFYSPGCSFCHKEIPLLKNEFFQPNKELGVKVVAINIDTDTDSWNKFVEDNDLKEWVNAYDPKFESRYWLKFNVSGTPSLYLLDKDKTIIAKRLDVKNLNLYFDRIKNKYGTN